MGAWKDEAIEEMGSYSYVELTAHSIKVPQRVIDAAFPSSWHITPDGKLVHKDAPIGVNERTLVVTWEDAKYGTENDSIQGLLQELRERQISYDIYDGGCGEWLPDITIWRPGFIDDLTFPIAEDGMPLISPVVALRVRGDLHEFMRAAERKHWQKVHDIMYGI